MSITLNVNGINYSYPEQGDTNWGAGATDWASAITTGTLQKAGGLFQILSELDFGSAGGLKSLYYKSRTANPATAGQIRLARADVISFRNEANDANLDLSVNSSNELLFNGVSLAGVATVTDTNSIDMVLTGTDLAANVKLSASAAGAGFLKNTLTIEADGLLVKTPIADTSTTGVLSDTDWDTFNSKQAAGSYITALTGDVVATGPGSVAAAIQSGVITNAMINSSAAIAYSKLNLTGSIVNADVNGAAAIEYAKLNLTGGIIGTDVAAGAAIEYTKLEVLTAQRALVSSGAGYVSAHSLTTATEIGYVNGVTSSIQTQLDAKVAKSAYTGKGVILSGSAASTPAALAAGTNGQVLIADSTVTEGVRWGAAASGGINYITNTNFAADTAGWATYANPAAAFPDTGSGGIANITFTRDTNSLVIGTTSGLITKSAANRQGEGVSYDFSIDTALKNSPVKITNYLAASANFVFGSIDGVTPSDVTVWVYDVTNSRLITPFPNVLTSNIGQFVGSFQATDSTSYRLIYHIGTPYALAWTLALGQVVVGPVDEAFIQADSDWVSYTPTISNFGTATGVSFRYRKQGPNVLIEGDFTAGTVAGSEARVSLPTGLTTSSSLPTIQAAGQYFRKAAGTEHGGAVLMEPSVSYVTFGAPGTFGNNSLSATAKANGNSVLNNTTGLIMTASIPIQGWTSGYATPAVSAQNVPVQFSAYKSAGSVTANTTIASWTGTFIDSVGAWNGTTGQYTVKIPGVYNIYLPLQTASADTEWAQILVNGTIFATSSGGGSTVSRKFAFLKKYLNVGDIVTVTHSANATIATNTTGTILSIEKVNDPSAFLNIPKVATIQDQKASGTDGGTATSGSYQTRTLNTLVDPFGIVSLASNQFVLQPGTYRINASCPAGSSSSTQVSYHKCKLRNITAGSDTIIGSSERLVSGASTSITNRSVISGVFSITVATTFEIQHRVATTLATIGFGTATSFGDAEVYTQVEIQKLL